MDIGGLEWGKIRGYRETDQGEFPFAPPYPYPMARPLPRGQPLSMALHGRPWRELILSALTPLANGDALQFPTMRAPLRERCGGSHLLSLPNPPPECPPGSDAAARPQGLQA